MTGCWAGHLFRASYVQALSPHDRMPAVKVLRTRHLAAREGSLRVLIADDHKILLDTLESVLTTHGFQVVGTAENGHRAVALARRRRADVAVLDATMPVMNGLEAARKILQLEPRLRVLILTDCGDEAVVAQALAIGVSGILVKAQGLEDLIVALRLVSSGALYVSPYYSPAVLESFSERPAGNGNGLTRREIEMLRLIADGKSMKQAASALSVSVRTAEWHRARLMDKLKIRDTATLVRYAIRQGLIVA